MSQIKKIIWDEINEYVSMADAWYAKKLGIVSTDTPENDPLDGEFIGIIHSDFHGKKYLKPAHVFKNPAKLKNFTYNCRGILLKNGDFYLMKHTVNVLHDELIKFLVNKNILPSSIPKDYPNDLPEEFISVERSEYNNYFLPSTLYNEFPESYKEMFQNANKKGRGYKFYFRLPKHGRDIEEQLDMNRAYSYHPSGLDPNRNFGRPF